MFERARTVIAADGKQWRVGIRWLPRRPRWKGWERRAERRESRADRWDWLSGVDVPDVEGCAWVLVALVVAVAVVFAWWLLFPIFFFVIDALILVVIAAGAVAARVLFRRPWIVQAVSDGETKEWPVVGWRASRHFVDAVAARLEGGRSLDDLPVSSRGTNRGSASPPAAR